MNRPECNSAFIKWPASLFVSWPSPHPFHVGEDRNGRGKKNRKPVTSIIHLSFPRTALALINRVKVVQSKSAYWILKHSIRDWLFIIMALIKLLTTSLLVAKTQQKTKSAQPSMSQGELFTSDGKSGQEMNLIRLCL